jgi:hypothetical protein
MRTPLRQDQALVNVGGCLMIPLALITLILSACTTTVNLTAKNVETFPQDVRVVTKDKSGQVDHRLSIGSVNPGGQILKTFDVEKGGEFTVTSRIPRSPDIFETSQTVSRHDPDPLNVTIDLVKQGEFLDDSSAIQTISDSFRKLGPNVGAYPLSTANALQTTLGALIVVTPGSGANEGAVHHKLNPGFFSRATTLTEFRYPDNEDKNSVKISGKSAVNLSSSFPMWGNAGFATSSDSIYEVDWILEGFGMFEKMEENDWNYLSAYNKLRPDIKRALAVTLEKNPGSTIMYVNRIYVVKRAQMTVKQGTKLDATARLDAGSVITGSGVYSFGKQQGQVLRFDESVLNYGGLMFTPVIKITGPKSAEKGQEVFHYPTWNLNQSKHPQNTSLTQQEIQNSQIAIDWVENKSAPDLEYEMLIVQPSADSYFLTKEMLEQAKILH